ncbi:hypothetical protein K9U40_19295 [Xanthobacter autotrophicus]|uniref:hypothetical protein n=1 Tax=Xanthobacter TaxID=279 RepID=UPI0024AA4975|nr:hypothetical protein [Xanthobacter autotrophicus]MDI4666454.1 hypothetical protein [Xanthobacter autotrophicus]
MRVSPNYPRGIAAERAADDLSALLLFGPAPGSPMLLRHARLLAAALLATGLAATAAPRPAAAQTFDGSSSLMESTLQLFGLKDDEPKPEIDYRERAPLVVPPKVPEALPPPQSSAADANPNWPKDPDVQRRKREAEASKTPIVRDDPGRPLLPSELKGGKHKNLGNSSSPSEPVGAESKRDVLLPDQLGFSGWINGLSGKQEQLSFNGEPERENLIQPPPGYQTPAPNAPYGVVEQKKEPFKFPTLFDRGN